MSAPLLIAPSVLAPPPPPAAAATAALASRAPIKSGRPPVLTQELIERLCAHLAQGNYLETAARAESVPANVVREWLAIASRVRRGLPPDGDRYVSPSLQRACLDLSESFEKADASAELQAHARLVQWGTKDWMAHMARMERRWPKRWARPAQRVEVSGPDGGPVESTLQLSWPGRAGLAALEPAVRALAPPDPDAGDPHPEESRSRP